MASDNNALSAIIMGPVLVVGSCLALWQNEGRFNYYEAARDTVAVSAPKQATTASTVSYTGDLNTGIPIRGKYVTRFDDYYTVRRRAEIYSWYSERRDNRTEWKKGWRSRVENNSRNEGIKQKLGSATLYPKKYQIDNLDISPENIHFSDEHVAIPPQELRLSGTARDLGLRSSGGYLYINRDAQATDQLGDERVSYSGIPVAATATYFGVIANGTGIGRQVETKEGIISMLILDDGVLHHLVNGDRETALETTKEHFTRLKWLVRLIATVVCVVGFYTFFSVFASLLYAIPILGSIVEVGVILVSIVLGVPLALFVILTAIIFHNPLTVALPLFLVIAGVVYFVRRSRKTKARAEKLLAARLTAKRNAEAAQKTQGTAQSAPVAAAATGAGTSTRETASDARNSDNRMMEQTFYNLAALAMAEDGLDKKENKFLVNWGKSNGISNDRMKALFAEAKQGAAGIKGANREDLELLVYMALADGVLSTKEWALLVKFAKELGITAIELRKFIVGVEKEAAAPA